MDIWSAEPGSHIDLGGYPAGVAGPDLTAQVLTRVAAALSGAQTWVESMDWRGVPDPPAGTRLRLTLLERPATGRRATVRVSIVEDGLLLADIRCRRAAVPIRDAAGLLSRPVVPGTAHQRDFPVRPDMLTDHVAGADPVLSTPTLIAAMEDTAADILRARFTPGAASLGTWIGVRHTGAARLRETVTIRATVADVRGRRIAFDVSAWVGGTGRPVGEGRVEQTMIWADEPR